MPLLQNSTSQKYTILLIVLVGKFLTYPFLAGSIGEVISSLIMLLTLVSIVRIFSWPKRLFYIYLAVAGLAFSIETISNFHLISHSNIPLILFILIIYSLYLSIAIWLILTLPIDSLRDEQTLEI